MQGRPTETISAELSRWICAAFERTLGGAAYDYGRITVAETTNSDFGDYQCNAAMSLAKALGKAPRHIAETVVKEAGLHESLERMEVAGAGFINMFLKADAVARRLEGLGEDLGVPAFGGGRTVVLDFSSPNVAKPMHIGHIRSTIIGSALAKLYRALGYRVVTDNHIGDWGTQFGILIMGYRHFVDPAALAAAPIEELERLYVKSYERSREDEAWLRSCRQELVKLQNGDEENLRLWRQFVEWSLKEFDRIYKRLNVSFDLIRGESHYHERLEGVVKGLWDCGLATESEGATVVFLEEEKLPVCIVRKSDGAFNYATTDLATALSRVEEFNPEKIVYVTDERQQTHFRQIFAICRRLGVQTGLEHVWFGLMRLPEGTFSTREGNVIRLERLLDEAERRALELVKKANPEMDASRQTEIARVVGIGAVKYADLSQNPQTMVTFTWDKALALEGNSGPYLQYAYARIASVRDKYAERFPGKDPESFPLCFSEPVERTLGVKAIRFPDVVIRAAESHKPSVVADYLYDLCQAYSAYYQNVPFLKAEEGIRESRVRLGMIVSRILRRGLDLLGIETLSRI